MEKNLPRPHALDRFVDDFVALKRPAWGLAGCWCCGKVAGRHMVTAQKNEVGCTP